MDNKNIPEAVASVTYSITSPNGFNALFTVRSTSGTELLNQMKLIESQLTTNGYKPQERKAWGGAKREEKPIVYVEGRACPMCGERLVETTTSTGKKLIKCSTQKFDFTTKQVSGCKYVEWGN